MRCAVYCANHGRLGDPRTLVDLALLAEEAGWDGFFLYDHIVVVPGRAYPSVDPWSVLAVVADRTRLVLGPLVTPLARRRPWELAHQAIALDRLAEGRLVLGAGLGEPTDFVAFGDRADPRERARRLDEALELLAALWGGEPVDHDGSWTLDGVALRPGPVRGRIPVWIAGRYPHRAPLRRAARWDGIFPINTRWELDDPLRPAQLEELLAVVRAERGGLDGFEVVTAGVTPADRRAAAAIAAPYARAGATWWLEIVEGRRGTVEELRRRVAAGPPRVAPPDR
ncbi:LLM class flavin-dependent oxidoreductase [Conexibacter arvalis]|uniref:Alkanesulfonate monooxygenase SsuD/methylene tetrahydromethanopterin reductase-like flavin-dependent oxidoreductase (Luciferase family) n=1 Tax=Conexibacter arvalis TaxID=912552 RepID=A0A840IAR7_9ACTN|nr:LLM class flavin-dependent oxidoreductase [Conexibacter arvalis]MBB4662007.1 alkanesulfonate monooxygenase SsuD/methylene tetrahydromethanopterin reductase-like flavin-dependent oxidoreductase (luciferase family) [Conexibacter arvalis]